MAHLQTFTEVLHVNQTTNFVRSLNSLRKKRSSRAVIYQLINLWCFTRRAHHFSDGVLLPRPTVSLTDEHHRSPRSSLQMSICNICHLGAQFIRRIPSLMSCYARMRVLRNTWTSLDTSSKAFVGINQRKWTGTGWGRGWTS